MTTSKVKSFIRNGKLVRAHSRKNQETKKKRNIVKTGAKVIGGTALLGGAAYLGLKGRYRKNLDNIASRLDDNLPIIKPVPPKKKAITFTVGGFGKPGDKKVTSEAMSTYLKGGFRRDLKTHHLVAFKNRFSPSSGKKGFVVESLGKVLEGPFRGRNVDSEKLAKEIYAYAKANPGKPINIVSHSAGSLISEDAAYILKKRGVDVKLVSLGGMDLKFVPKHKNTLNITSKNDPFRRIRKPKSVFVNEVKGHNLRDYIQSNQVKERVKKYLND